MDYMSRKVFLYIAASLDGFIAQPNDDLSFLKLVEKEGEDYGYADFIKEVDTVVVGRKTYDWVKKHVPDFGHTGKDCYVITRTERPPVGKTIFYTGEPQELISQLKQQSGKNIFVDGGAELVNSLLKHNLFDEYIISIIPVFTGAGVRLFKDDNFYRELKFVSAKSFDTGLVQLHYRSKD